MPTIKRVPGPYRLYFYSFDCNEPVHVHVERDRLNCKFWLDPVVLASNNEFSSIELRRIRVLVQEHASKIRKAWNEHCTQGRSPDHDGPGD